MSCTTIMVYVEAEGHATRARADFGGPGTQIQREADRDFGASNATTNHRQWNRRDRIARCQHSRDQGEARRESEMVQLVAGADRPKLLWRPVIDFPVDAVAREARSADLIVIGPSPRTGDAYVSLDPGEAILRLGRPALFVPGNVSVLRAEHVVIAWKDVREARSAVQDALPLLHEAARVTVAEICEAGDEERTQARLDDVAAYLAQHGIKGGPRVILHREGFDADQLITLAQEEGADLLVTGAYGHSRLGEWVFGGVTRDLLAHSPICCLMSH